jgi:molybdopterin synthase sulfur carrier subunit
MALVHLRGPLKVRTGGRGQHEIAGATVGTVLRDLEEAHPDVRGWILDERACIRRHINVYVNGEQAHESTPVADDDRLEILPAISGGAR